MADDLQTFTTLCAEDRFAEACALAAASPEIQASAGALDHYVHALKVGAPDQEEAALLAILRRQPGHRLAQARFFELHRNQVPGPEVAAHYRSLPEAESHSVVLAKRAQLAMGDDDFDGALILADKALAAADSPELVELVRKLLARLLMWYGQHDLAERFLMRPDQPNDEGRRLANVLELWRGSSRDVIPDLAVRLLAFEPYRQRAWLDLLDYRWSTEGATPALLQDSLAWTCNDAGAVLMTERIALAVQLGQRAEATEWLRALPEAGRRHRQNLPLALLIDDDPSLAHAKIKLDEVRKDAALFAGLMKGSQDLAGLLTTPSLRLAIVGNSPCERGLSRGNDIDGHDLVVRFNRISALPELQVDYGRRTDIHIVATGGNPYELPAPSTRFALMTVPSALYRNRNWNRARSLLDRGYGVATVLGDSYARLATALVAPPSSGLRVCGYVAELRPDLAGVDTFGFSFVDQVSDRQAAHYAGGHRAANHAWQREADLFQVLMRRGLG